MNKKIIFIIFFMLFCPAIYCKTASGQGTQDSAGSVSAGSNRVAGNRKVDNQYLVWLMPEFGYGNMLSFYFAVRIKGFFFGSGLGYLYCDDEEFDTAVHIVEPAALVFKQVHYFLFRLRLGPDFAKEDRFGFSRTAVTVSPDIMVYIKKYTGNLYAGISLPVIMGREGTALSFSAGVGYFFPFYF